VAHLGAPARSSRLGLGLETPLVHALVDRLLGYARDSGAARAPVTPVEAGVVAFALARTLAALGDVPGTAGLVLDRVGPERFDPTGLGRVATLRWPVQVGPVRASARLWLPEALAWDLDPPAGETGIMAPADDPQASLRRFAALTGTWHAEAGRATLPWGPGRLRVGGVLPIDGAPLGGTPSSPVGPIELGLRDRDGRSWFPARCAPMSGGGQLVLTGPLRRDPLPREALAVNLPRDPEPDPIPAGPSGDPAPAAGVPVTLVVELGRISLTVQRVAELAPGDVLTLGRHAREPVELTSGGKLIARGELVQIDTELGVRVTNVFF
jgi:type III secretion system YscQ/HrcQ family protein